MRNFFLILLIIFSLVSCIADRSTISVSGKKNPNLNSNPANVSQASVSSVQIINHQLVITGAGLADVTDVKVGGNSLNENFSIESQSATQIIANSISAFSFDVAKVFNLILSDANASATFPIDFSLCNATLNGKGFNCAITAMDKDVLSYDSVSGLWKPRAATGINYLGAFNASTNPPAPTPNPFPSSGSYYIVSADGMIGATSFVVGDWLISNGTAWQKIGNSTLVTSVFSRTGNVVAQEGDYDLDKLTDVDLSIAPTNGKVLKFNGTKWIASDDLSGGGAGSVTATEIAAGAVTDAKIDTVSATKITGTLTSTQILDGTIVNADISGTAAIDYSKLNIPNTTIPYAKLNIADGDIPAAKISGIPSVTSVLANTIVDGDTTHAPDGNAVFDALGLKFNSTGGVLTIGTISGIPLPTNGDDVVNKQYVDSYGQWTKNGSDIYRASGNVGIGTSATASRLEVRSDISTTYNSTSAIIPVPTDLKLTLNNQNNTVGSYSLMNWQALDGGGSNNHWFAGIGGSATSFGGPFVIGNRTGLNAYSEKFRISSSGNVGIGTTSPSSTLQVNGTINGGTLNSSFLQTNDSATHNYKIATLPVSTASTYDHLHLIVTLNPNWLAVNNSQLDLFFANRNSFTYQYTAKGAIPGTAARVVAYNNGGAIDIYLNFPGTNSYTNATYSILEAQHVTVYPNPSDVAAPAGAVVFDSSSTTYPPAMINTFAGNVGIRTATPLANFHLVGKTATDNFLGLFAESGITPQSSAVAATSGHMVSVQGNGAAFFMGRDVTNNIEFIMGTSFLGTTFAGSMTAHDFQLRTNNNTKVTIQQGTGNVGIGASAPTSGLQVNTEGSNVTDGALFLVNGINGSFGGGGTIAGIKTTAADGGNYNLLKVQNAGGTKFIINGSGNVGIGTSTPGYKLQVGEAADGSEARANAWNVLSDERLKRDFEIIPESLEKILSLNGYYYYWNRGADTSKKLGLKAQEVEKVFPEVVSHGKDGFLSVSYNHLVAGVIEAVKEFFQKWQGDSKGIHREIASLKKDNELLKKDNELLKKDNELLKKDNESLKKDNELIKVKNLETQLRLEKLERVIFKGIKIQ
jgi:hypothetical protein